MSKKNKKHNKGHKNNTIFIPSSKDIDEINNLPMITDIVKGDLIKCHRQKPEFKRTIIDAITCLLNEADEFGVDDIEKMSINYIDYDTCKEITTPSMRRDLVINILDKHEQNYDPDEIPELSKIHITTLYLKDKSRKYIYYYMVSVPTNNTGVVELSFLA